jgi:hypothetical protein
MCSSLIQIGDGTSADDTTWKSVFSSSQARVRYLLSRIFAPVAIALAMTFAPGTETLLKADQPKGTLNDSIMSSINEQSPATRGLEKKLGNTCPMHYDLPADIALDLPSSLGQLVYDRYSWSTFLALAAPGVDEHVSHNGDNQTQWDQWSSTVDVIQCNLDSTHCLCVKGDCRNSGARYYPPICRAIPNYEKYRVLDQLSKVDDAFLESAQTNQNGTPIGGLGNSPVVDKNGKFLRYEILISPATYDFVVQNQYYNNAVLQGLTRSVTFPCGELDYRGGDPANRRLGALWIKNAWMELPSEHSRQFGPTDGEAYDDAYATNGYGNNGDRGRSKRDTLNSRFHTEKLLVYTPSYRNLDGIPSCELHTMALVGQHIFHKTEKQIRGVWSTVEHKDNAPDCTDLPPPGDMGGAGPSKACPASVNKSYNFYPAKCSADGSDPEACQACNTPPVSNAPAGTCINPNIAENDVGFCVNLPPAPVAGTTRACLQVPVAEYYPTAHRLNEACARQLGPKSVWSNYQLISTMYYDFDNPLGCRTIGEFASKPGETLRVLQRPLVPVGPGQDNPLEAPRKPFLANSSMETDVRSDCMGCHSGATVKDAAGNNLVGTDFAYWLQLEVPAGGAIDVVNPH